MEERPLRTRQRMTQKNSGMCECARETLLESSMKFRFLFVGTESVSGSKAAPVSDSESAARRLQQRHRLKLDWELLFWMFAAFATLYFTNFASHLLFNDKINRYTISINNA